jgi:flagellar basal body-associated protein FliL
MKRVFVIVTIMLLVAGSAIAGLMVLDIVPNPFAATEEMAEDGEGENGEEGDSGFVPPERAPILYPLEDLVIPVILDARIAKRIYITARLEIAPGNRAAVENGMPRMESALNERLIVYFQNHFARYRRPDLRGIKREMVAAAQQVYGEMVADVLLITVFEQ